MNLGYVTSVIAGTNNEKADRGGSIRAGILNKGLFGNGRFGFYGGYLWYNEFSLPDAEYSDRGSLLMLGVNFLTYKKGNSNWYLNLGLSREKFISTYATGRSEYEINIIPDFGVLYNIKNINIYLGWQPSEPHHFNLGLGYTFDSSLTQNDSGY